jgi:hypothetical protein
MTNSGHREQASSSFFMPSTMISMGEDPMWRESWSLEDANTFLSFHA